MPSLARTYGFGGPVGLFHASLGFGVAVMVARVWEYFAQEAHCAPKCPDFASQAPRLHHSYYGLGFLIGSATVLAIARRQRVRWDSSLFFGIGAGLLADEFGLLFLGIPYSHPISIMVLAIFASVFLVSTLNAAQRDGTRELDALDHSDAFTVAAVLLGLAGVLYLDRPLVPSVELLGAVSAVASLALLLLFGKTHFHRTWRGPG